MPKIAKQESVALREDDPPSKRALVASALRLFVAKGVWETTIRDVAKDAGFTNPAIFKFFKGRDDLAQCVFERCYERLASALAPAQQMPGFEPRLCSLVTEAAAFMDRDLDAFLFVSEELRNFWPRVSPLVRRQSIIKTLNELFRLGRAEGVVTRESDVGLLVASVVGTLSQTARFLYFKELKGPATRLAPRLSEMFLSMSRCA